MGTKVAIILSGCGNRDGAEIHESVLTILAVARAGAEPVFFAPDIVQTRVVNFLTGESLNEKRNVMLESARIARGKIERIEELRANQADALIFPGGQGAALNLCSFLREGTGCSVLPEVDRVIKDFHAAGKPIGFICIAPVLAARVLGPKGIELTIGDDLKTAAALEKMGARHFRTPPDGIHVDRINKIVSTPAYMSAGSILQVEAGISKLVKALMEMAA